MKKVNLKFGLKKETVQVITNTESVKGGNMSTYSCFKHCGPSKL